MLQTSYLSERVWQCSGMEEVLIFTLALRRTSSLTSSPLAFTNVLCLGAKETAWGTPEVTDHIEAWNTLIDGSKLFWTRSKYSSEGRSSSVRPSQLGSPLEVIAAAMPLQGYSLELGPQRGVKKSTAPNAPSQTLKPGHG